VVDVEKKKKKIEKQILTREDWNDALRVPPPYPSKKTYNRKKDKYKYNDKSD